MDISRMNDSINILRSSWKEGNELYEKITKSDEGNYWPEYSKWNTKTESFFKYLFYNQEFLDSFKQLVVYDDGYGNQPEMVLKETVGSKLGFIESHGLLMKKGYIKDQAVGLENSNSKNAFIAMWFSGKTNDTYSLGIKPAVDENHYDAIRIDKIEHNDKIDEKILEKIRDSRFLIADYTGHRGGVYFEAGYAKGLGLPVIPICRKGEESELHFDVKMYNTIIYNDLTELKSRLEERIKETIGVYREIDTQFERFEDDIPF